MTDYILRGGTVIDGTGAQDVIRHDAGASGFSMRASSSMPRP